MKAKDVNLKEHDNFNMSCNTVGPRQRYSHKILWGQLFPTTKRQAMVFTHFSVLNSKDINDIETFMNKHGFTGDYKYTKNKYFARLENTNDFIKALKLEFKF